jgi:hypothetical protein
MSVPGNPERRLVQYAREQQEGEEGQEEEQQESAPRSTQPKRHRGEARQGSRLRRFK